MEKLALYRKYRPNNLTNLIGQDFVKTTLVNAFKSNSVAHAYILSGPRGTGKTSTARLIAKMLNCGNLQKNFEPCDKCEFCLNINDSNLIDLIEIDAASNRGIDEIRALKEVINFRPTNAKYKIYIIDEVHMMTNEAFNALLKTLEEPPEYAYFILATTEIHKIPETIISRCQRFDFKRIAENDIVERLNFIAKNENIQVKTDVLKLIAKNVSGGMRDAIGLFEQFTNNGAIIKQDIINALGIADAHIIDSIIELLENANGTEAIKQLEKAYNQGIDLNNLSDKIVAKLRIKMLSNLEKKNTDKAGLYIGMIKTILDSKIFNESSIPQLALEVAFTKIGGCKEYDFSTPISSNKNTKILIEEKKTVENQKIKIDNTNTSEQEKYSSSVAKSTTKKSIPIKDITEKKETIKSKKHTEKPLGNSDITREWNKIVKEIKSPAIRMSLNTARIADIKGETVTLTFNSQFHMEKSIGKESKTIVENIAYRLTGINYRFKGKIEASKDIPAYRKKESTSSKQNDEPSAEDIAIGIFS